VTFFHGLGSQLHQLTNALKQQMLKELHENHREKSTDSSLSVNSPGETIA